MSLSWIAVDAMTGYQICDLPNLDVPVIGESLCDYWSGAAELPLPTAPREWRQATNQWATYLVLLEDDLPIWGCWVTTRKPNDGNVVPLTIATWEAYLDKRYCGSTSYNQAIYTSIAEGVIRSFVQPSGPAFLLDVQPGTTRGDLNAQDADDRTVLSVMKEMSGRESGPEWTVDWTLTDDNRYLPIFRIAPRIGVGAGYLPPAAVFDMPGCLTEFELAEDWTDKRGANDVMAVAIPDGNERLTSGRIAITDPIRPKLELRWTPSTSITQQSTLISHALNRLAATVDGSNTWKLTASAIAAPKRGKDWDLGDDIGYHITAPSVSEFLPDGSFNPVYGVARCIDWEYDMDDETVTPTLYSLDDLETTGGA